MMLNWIKFKTDIIIFFKTLFRGLKVADDKVLGKTKNNQTVDTSVEETIQSDTVYDALLRGEITQEVEELRDANYRIGLHANDYEYIGNGHAKKKDKNDQNMLAPKIKVFNPDGEGKIILVQDNRDFVLDLVSTINYDGDVAKLKPLKVLNFTYRDFSTYNLSDLAKKCVVREMKEDKSLKIDVYFSSILTEKKLIQNSFINLMGKILAKEIRNVDSLEISSITFITQSCFGARDLMRYNIEVEDDYTVSKYSVNQYVSDYVVTYKIKSITTEDLTEKYHTKELDEKYATHAPKNPNGEVTFEIENYQPERELVDEKKQLDLIQEYFRNSESPK